MQNLIYKSQFYVWLFERSHRGSNSSERLTDGVIRNTLIHHSVTHVYTFLFFVIIKVAVWIYLYVWCMFALDVYFLVLKVDADLGENIEIT
jgi:hypothetical protein